MNATHEDRFVLFVRHGHGPEGSPGQVSEQPLGAYPTYQEARLLRRQLSGVAGDLVIRYVGPTGGGD